MAEQKKALQLTKLLLHSSCYCSAQFDHLIESILRSANGNVGVAPSAQNQWPAAASDRDRRCATQPCEVAAQ